MFDRLKCNCNWLFVTSDWCIRSECLGTSQDESKPSSYWLCPHRERAPKEIRKMPNFRLLPHTPDLRQRPKGLVDFFSWVGPLAGGLFWQVQDHIRHAYSKVVDISASLPASHRRNWTWVSWIPALLFRGSLCVFPHPLIKAFLQQLKKKSVH